MQVMAPWDCRTATAGDLTRHSAGLSCGLVSVPRTIREEFGAVVCSMDKSQDSAPAATFLDVGGLTTRVARVMTLHLDFNK